MFRQCHHCGGLYMSRVGQRKYCEPCREKIRKIGQRKKLATVKDEWNDSPALFEALAKRDHVYLQTLLEETCQTSIR